MGQDLDRSRPEPLIVMADDIRKPDRHVIGIATVVTDDGSVRYGIHYSDGDKVSGVMNTDGNVSRWSSRDTKRRWWD